MKNLIKFVSVLGFFICGFAFGQKLTKEETRLKSSEMLIGIKNSTESVYKDSSGYENFREKLTGSKEACSTKEGENLLNEVYDFQKNNISNDEIRKTYDGLAVAKAFLKLNEINITEKTENDGSVLFVKKGSLNDTSKIADNGCGCKWYQIGCWFKCIFGVDINVGIIIFCMFANWC